MPQAIVDPEELRRFAQSLKKFNTDMQERLTSLNGQSVALGRTWRDQEQKKFAEEFEQQMQVLARFIELIDRHIPYLVRKAEIIEEYLQQR
ncbi:MAG: WXG100 family type VII secretion target [Acidobacteria bacterium]|jgi:WXG100 family type VII secretion target|nr:WXG100 family type VII secretion target [Acidobacteriota bacterium]